MNFILPSNSVAQNSSENLHNRKDDVFSNAKKAKLLKSRNLGNSSTTENIYHSYNDCHVNKSTGIYPSVISNAKVTSLKTMGPKQKSQKRLTMTIIITDSTFDF